MKDGPKHLRAAQTLGLLTQKLFSRYFWWVAKFSFNCCPSCCFISPPPLPVFHLVFHLLKGFSRFITTWVLFSKFWPSFLIGQENTVLNKLIVEIWERRDLATWNLTGQENKNRQKIRQIVNKPTAEWDYLPFYLQVKLKVKRVSPKCKQ